MKAWRNCKLGDVMTLKRGHDLPSDLRQEGEIPVVSSSGITGYHNEAKAAPPGVVTGRYGTIGEVFYLDQEYWPLNTALYVIDFKGTDPKFAAYFLRNVLKGYQSDKAAVPGVDRNVLHEISVAVPEAAIQQRIADTLTAYVDLMENNRRRMAFLEESARLLYREWFVHLRFPGHEKATLTNGVPEGWERVPLNSLASVTMGLSPKGDTYNECGDGMPLVNGPVEFGERFTKRVKWTTSPTKVCKSGELIVCVRGSTTGKYVISDGEYCLGRGVCGISSTHQCFVNLTFENELRVLLPQTSGSTFPSWTGPQLKLHPVWAPPTALLDQFENQVTPNYKAIAVLSQQTQKLRIARDLLLPRLMSGEIDV